MLGGHFACSAGQSYYYARMLEGLDTGDLLNIANMKMPFGKYKGRALIDLPEPYVVWFYKQGFPQGELGRLLEQLYEIKLNGLEALFEPLKKAHLGR